MWWESVKELIEYARGENPDAYRVLEMANRIAAEWNKQKPPATNDESTVFYTQIT